MQAADLTGQRFGMLTVIERVENPEGTKRTVAYWLCECDCGNKSIVCTSKLKKGHTKSCGCNRGAPGDLAGTRFGMLTVVKRVPKPDDVKRYGTFWLCKCDCGNETIADADSLKRGHTNSCGCYAYKVRVATIKNKVRKDGVVLDTIGRRIGANNSSGYMGVYYLKNRKKWRAAIGYAKQTIHLGEFIDIESAIAARKEAEELLYKPLLTNDRT